MNPPGLPSLFTRQADWATYVSFVTGAYQPELGIFARNNGIKSAESRAYMEGYKIPIDDQGRNVLTGHDKNGEEVPLKILEVYEIECIFPPKQY